MKRCFIWTIFTFAMVLGLPCIMINIFAPPTKQVQKTVKVYFKDEEETREMDFEEYIKGVVAAEMPANFEIEALKAQAVAARSYALHKMKGGKEDNGADVCTDFAHCQAYITDEKARANWGENADNNFKKISQAVDETSGKIMEYDGEVVTAVFHSTSSGATESAIDVWGGDVPYLTGVKSEGEHLSPKYLSTVTVGIDVFKEKLKEENEKVDFAKPIIADVDRSESGGIKTIVLYGEKFKGTRLRSLFSLRSTNFDMSIDNENVIFNVKGNGHGVGMSQYGANYMASVGKKYDEILLTYYTGVKICDMTE